MRNVKNIKSSSISFVFSMASRIKLSESKTVQNRENIVRTSKPIFFTLNYQRLLKVLTTPAPVKKIAYE